MDQSESYPPTPPGHVALPTSEGQLAGHLWLSAGARLLVCSALGLWGELEVLRVNFQKQRQTRKAEDGEERPQLPCCPVRKAEGESLLSPRVAPRERGTQLQVLTGLTNTPPRPRPPLLPGVSRAHLPTEYQNLFPKESRNPQGRFLN